MNRDSCLGPWACSIDVGSAQAPKYVLLRYIHGFGGRAEGLGGLGFLLGLGAWKW